MTVLPNNNMLYFKSVITVCQFCLQHSYEGSGSLGLSRTTHNIHYYSMHIINLIYYLHRIYLYTLYKQYYRAPD